MSAPGLKALPQWLGPTACTQISLWWKEIKSGRGSPRCCSPGHWSDGPDQHLWVWTILGSRQNLTLKVSWARASSGGLMRSSALGFGGTHLLMEEATCRIFKLLPVFCLKTSHIHPNKRWPCRDRLWTNPNAKSQAWRERERGRERENHP